MIKDREYSTRVVAFLDILGFSHHVDRSIVNSTTFSNIWDAQSVLYRTSRENYDGILEEFSIGKQVTNFSDSIVISYDYSFGGSLFYILMDLIFIQVDLIVCGFLARGGIAIGNLCHDQTHLFGPAMIEAYMLESKYANYPRIILSEETLLKGIQSKGSANSYQMEYEYLLSILKKDNDGFYYLNYIEQHQEFDDNEQYYKFLSLLKEIILKGLDEHKLNPHVLKKYKWIRNQYNIAIKQHKKYIISGYKRKFHNDFKL